ncbi:hypothetical protein EVAR_60854_1 [Eumeta japonica]|uniref:Uncharacterized protein n=1 Tax=Eumeta variegata TaxID=151549 RepID=A0A4C1Y5U4_EUMVA|nr:hypothetical protein EVAR_60854_1 [Eumeta japonica]
MESERFLQMTTGTTKSCRHRPNTQGKQRLRKRNPTHARHPIDFQTFEYAHLDIAGPKRAAGRSGPECTTNTQFKSTNTQFTFTPLKLGAVQVMLSIGKAQHGTVIVRALSGQVRHLSTFGHSKVRPGEMARRPFGRSARGGVVTSEQMPVEG